MARNEPLHRIKALNLQSSHAVVIAEDAKHFRETKNQVF